MTPRPVALSVRVEGAPESLRSERRCALWHYEWRDGRWTKMQYQPSGHAAKSNDPTTWCSFAAALAAYRTGRFDGISFALGDGWTGVDIDHAVGHVLPLLEALGGYRETSPSGQGCKVFGRGPRIGGQIDCAVQPPAFTTWSAPRFFTITGQNSSGDPHDDISAFIDARFPAPVAQESTREGYADAATTSDDDLLLQMIGTDSVGDGILALRRGDLSAYRKLRAWRAGRARPRSGDT
jgi:primase-polymerase (primpol)-like protein